MLQLRTAETERAELQAAQTEAAAGKQTLTDANAKLVKQLADVQDSAKKQIEDLAAKESAKDADIKTLTDNVDKWKAGVASRDEIIVKLQKDRSKLQLDVIDLQRRVEDQRRKNQEMYKIGSEILSRYEHFGLGTALTAREPFVGTTRVKLEGLVQDYQDKLTDSTIKPESPPGRAVEQTAKKK